MPRDILDFEIDYLKSSGVEILPNFIVGRTKELRELFKEGFLAVFLGLGAGVPSFLGIPGENLSNVYSANEFLTRINLMSAYEFPKSHTPVNIGKHILVIGGGNTAMDAARCALRLQKMNNIDPDTTIVYRRTEAEIPPTWWHKKKRPSFPVRERAPRKLLKSPVAFFRRSGRKKAKKCFWLWFVSGSGFQKARLLFFSASGMVGD